MKFTDLRFSRDVWFIIGLNVVAVAAVILPVAALVTAGSKVLIFVTLMLTGWVLGIRIGLLAGVAWITLTFLLENPVIPDPVIRGIGLAGVLGCTAFAGFAGETQRGLVREIRARREAEAKLQGTIEEMLRVRAERDELREFVPICATCKNVRDEDDNWHPVEWFIGRKTDSSLTHGMCPNCYQAAKAEFAK